jgi:putative ABC transport system ATP-binding protein
MSLRGLGRTFASPEGPLRILAGLDVDIHAGDFLVLHGPSGCGKTTLLHLMALLDRPDTGEIFWQGENTRGWNDTRRARARADHIGMVFQQFHTLPHRSVADNLALRLQYTGVRPPSGRGDELLRRFDLSDRARHPARLLSGGESQRLCIARALLVPPMLLLADEPTGNLDPRRAAGVREAFSQARGEAGAVVVATHDPAWAELATRVLRFENGKVMPA